MQLISLLYHVRLPPLLPQCFISTHPLKCRKHRIASHGPHVRYAYFAISHIHDDIRRYRLPRTAMPTTAVRHAHLFMLLLQLVLLGISPN